MRKFSYTTTLKLWTYLQIQVEKYRYVAEIQASSNFFWFIWLVGWLARKQLVMADARLQAELAEAKAEVLRLRESISVATPVVHKDLSLVSLVPKWSSAESSVSLEEFFR
jgi:hypothetical protein